MMERAVRLLLSRFKAAVLEPLRRRWPAAWAALRRGYDVAMRYVARLRALLAAQPSGRLQAALSGLLLVEAFLACLLLGHLIGDLDANPLSNAQPPNDVGLLFAVVVLMPALILATRAQYRATQAEEQRRARMLRLVDGDLARAYSILYLQPGAPLHIAQAAYAAAMKQAHPDRPGGDTRSAAELNWAIATIRAHEQARRAV
jgi:hypothetical protein